MTKLTYCTRCMQRPTKHVEDTMCLDCIDAVYMPRIIADDRVAARSAARMGER